MYLKRKIDEFLVQWKNNKDRLPLIVKGQGRLERPNLLIILQKNITAILFILILCLNRNIKRY